MKGQFVKGQVPWNKGKTTSKLTPEQKAEANRKRSREFMRKKNNSSIYGSYKENYDLEAHHQLALNSGIQSYDEWLECWKLGMMPVGIVRRPDRKFKKPEVENIGV